jgi:hypothetical protein
MRKSYTISILIISLLLFCIPSLAQSPNDTLLQNRIWVWDDFSGGLNTKLSEFSLPKNQAVICENLRFDSELNSLTKRDQVLLYGTADATESITGAHRIYLKDGTKTLVVTHGDEIEKGTDSTGAFTNILDLSTGNYRWQWVTWNNVAIGTDGYNQPVKYDGSSASATYLGTCLALDAGSGAGPNGTYTYKVTFYTASYEVAFNVASNSITVTDNDINLSMIPIGPDTYSGETVVGRKIYRNQNGGSIWYLLSNGTIADNTTTTLTDSDSDAELTATTYPTTYTATPPKGKLLIIHFNRLFIANDPNQPSRLYYSDDGNPDYFVPTDYYLNIRPDDGDQITMLITWLGILTVGKENSIQKVYTDGDTPSTDWSISDPFSYVGCKAMYTPKATPIGIIYLGSNGLYRFTGQRSELISEAVTPEINDISESNLGNCWGEYHKNKYYLAYPSKATGSSTNNRVLIFDILSNAYDIDKLSVNCFTAFNSGTDWDILYYGSSTDGKVYSYAEQTYEVVHNKHSDFTGTFTNARYIPTTAGGDANNPVIEIARTGDVDSMSGTIDNLTGTIDRDSLTGTYVSQGLNIGASTYDKLYWNESMVSGGDDVTIAIRSASTEAGLSSASWSSEFTDPSGSDISGETADDWVQYRISLTTDDYGHSPTVYRANNYNVKLTYRKLAATTETSIPIHWKSGWTDLGYPGYVKSLKKIYVYHEGTAGTLTLTFSNFEGDTDTFNIDLSTYPNSYTEYFTAGKFIGELFNLDITNDDLNSLEIKKIIVIFDVEPLV